MVYFKTVYEDIQLLEFLFIQPRYFIQSQDLPIQHNPGKALLHQHIAFNLQVPVPGGQVERGKNADPDLVIQGHDFINDLSYGIASHKVARNRRIGLANPGKKQLQVFVNLCGSPYCRPWIRCIHLLLDGYGR